MDKIKRIFSEIKLISNSPKLYIVAHFDEIRCQIDIEYANLLCSTAKEKETESTEFLPQQQQELIHEVDLFQKQCLFNLDSNQMDYSNLQDWEHRLKALNQDDKEAVLTFQKELYCELYSRKKALFLNKGMLFLSMKNYNNLVDTVRSPTSDLLYGTNIEIRLLFGSLILIEDEFLIYSDKFLEYTQ